MADGGVTELITTGEEMAGYFTRIPETDSISADFASTHPDMPLLDRSSGFIVTFEDYELSGADVNGDNRIGLEEIVYVLGCLSEVKE